MSRCFPFPPPGYMRNGACSEDLMKSTIKSTKLQKERDEAKEQRKKDKRKKKEKRKERKERKENEASATHHDKGKGKECKLRKLEEAYQLEKITAEQGSGCLQKVVGDDDNEQIERSGITEEHDQPFSSAEPCCLSDSTQSSNKRKRSASPSSSEHGTAIKIRLPLRKHREQEELQQDYRAGSAGSIGITKPVTEELRHQLQGQRNSESDPKEYQFLFRAGVDPSTNSVDSKRGRMASLYDSLFQNWNPCALQQLKGFELEDEDWLSTSKRQEQTQATKKAKSVNDALGCSSSTLWPRAQHLPEADIYALPYTVPF